MAKRTFALGIMVLAVGAQIPAFAISKGMESDGCGLLIASVKMPEYHPTQKKRQNYVRLRSYANRQHAYTGETTDLMKRCGGTTLAATTVFSADLLLVARFSNTSDLAPNKARYDAFMNEWGEARSKESTEYSQKNYPGMRTITGQYLMREIKLK